MLALPLLYWCVNVELAFEVCCVFLSSMWCNSTLKELFRVPRPPLSSVKGWAFPSGHAQGTSSFWGYLAFFRPSALTFKLFAAAIIVLVAISRVYLGVHWPSDVVGGIVIGLGWAYLLSRPGRLRAGRSAAWLCAGVLLYLLFSGGDSSAPAGALQGLALGHLGQKKWIDMDTCGPMTQKVWRYLVGLGVMSLVLFGLRAILPGSVGFRFLRYLATGFGATFVAPWLFVLTGLAKARTGR
ncbi:MAG TPA: phosphatase PAP2 family protein [Firmicutes bacterium]|nr:phosphatase PAP2 family protein [Bacillota bacterium]